MNIYILLWVSHVVSFLSYGVYVVNGEWNERESDFFKDTMSLLCNTIFFVNL